MRDQAYDRILRRIDDRSAVCAVVGLGYIGSALFRTIHAGGYVVHGIDHSDAAIAHFKEHNGSLLDGTGCTAGSSKDVIDDADVIVIAVRVAPTCSGTADVSTLELALKMIASQAKPTCLVVVECTVPVGTTRRLITAAFDSEAINTGLFSVHCPERMKVGDDDWPLERIPHLVGGLDPLSTQLGVQFVSTICQTVMPVSSPEVSELSKLLENAFLAIGISLLGEITRISHRFGISATEVAQAAATKPFGYFPFYPGAGVGGHCIPNDLELLCQESHSAGIEHSVLDAASAVIDLMPAFVVDYLAQVAQRKGADLREAIVLIIGLGFKIGSQDTTASPAVEVIRQLRNRGAVPVYLDHFIDEFEVDSCSVKKLALSELVSIDKIPFGIILAGDISVDAKLVEDKVDLLIDTGGGRILNGILERAVSL